jgi:hypothetical protein
MTMQIVNATASPEVQINENFSTLSASALFGRRQPATTGLAWGFYGGYFDSVLVADGTVSLTASATNYIVANRSTGVVSASTATTNWNNTVTFARLFVVATSSTGVTSAQDHRVGPKGIFGGGGGEGGGPLDWNEQTASYTLGLVDAEGAVAMNVASANTVTVPPESSVAFPIGTSILIYQEGAGATTITAGAGVTLRARAGLTQVLNGQYAMATVVKRATNTWVLAGDLA